MDAFAKLTGRQYHLFDYEGPDDAERVIILMGSGAETARDTADGCCGTRARRWASCRCGCSARFQRRISSPRCR